MLLFCFNNDSVTYCLTLSRGHWEDFIRDVTEENVITGKICLVHHVPTGHCMTLQLPQRQQERNLIKITHSLTLYIQFCNVLTVCTLK